MNTTPKTVSVYIRELHYTYNFNIYESDTIGTLKKKVLDKLIIDYRKFIDFMLWDLEIFRVQSKDFVQDNDLIIQKKHSDYFEILLIKKK